MEKTLCGKDSVVRGTEPEPAFYERIVETLVD